MSKTYRELSLASAEQVQFVRRKRNRIIVTKYVNTKTGAVRSLPHKFVTVWESEEHKPKCEPTIYINVVRGIRSKQAVSFFSREVYIRDLTTGKMGYLLNYLSRPDKSCWEPITINIINHLKERNNMKTMMLVIDCEPFAPRPDVYAQFIYETILGIELPHTVSRCFGAWTWPSIEVTEEQKELIGIYLKDLYAHGYIRYAEW